MSSAQFDAEQKAALLELAMEWEHRSRKQAQCARETADEAGRRLVEHGAFCYFNAAAELRKVVDLGELALPLSAS